MVLMLTFNVSSCQGLPGPKGIKGKPLYDLSGLPVSSLTLFQYSHNIF